MSIEKAEELAIKKRLVVFQVAIFLLLFILISRLCYLQILKGANYTQIAQRNVIRVTYYPAPRGKIVDRHGRILAYDVARFDVGVIPAKIKDEDKLILNISKIMNVPPDKLREKIDKGRKTDPYSKVVLKTHIDKATMVQLAELSEEYPEIFIDVRPFRVYPMGKVASHILGYVGEVTKEELKKRSHYIPGDTVGKDGIEKEYDKYLHGRAGKKEVLVDVSGRIIKVIKDIPPKAGDTVQISIDAKFQKAVEDILRYHVKSLSAISGEPLAASAIVMDVKTGEILAMASIPDYDPNKFVKGLTPKEYKELIKRKDYPLLNRAISGAYPLASTFKIVTALASLQEGICTRYSPFYCKGYYTVGTHKFYCFLKTGHGKIDFNEAIAQSCDVVFYSLGDKLGIEKLLKYARQFGLGERTHIDLPGEISGLLPDHYWKMKTLKEPWYEGDTINLSIGQGYLAATPIQLLVIAETVVNKGVMLRPHLLMDIKTPEGNVIKKYSKEVMRKVSIDQRHFEAVMDGMRSAVRKGTAKRYNAPISAGGKTGTAENFPCPENPHGRNHTWFVGFAPAYNPEVVFVVFFERSGGYAGKRTVPIASEIMKAYAKLKHIR